MKAEYWEYYFEYWSEDFVSFEAFHFFSNVEECILADNILSYKTCNQYRISQGDHIGTYSR